MEESEFSSLRSDVASLKGDIAGIRATVTAQAAHNTRVDAWLQNISNEVRESLHNHQETPLSAKNNAPIITSLIAGVAVLISLGTFALSPVRENVKDLQDEVREVRKHEDGHPRYVSERLDALVTLNERDRREHREAIQLDEERMDKLSTDVAILQTIADERTVRFIRTLAQRDKLQELMAQDRFTGSEQSAYAAAIEQRLRTLEDGRLGWSGGRRQGRDDE